jgi:hypothetical protein
VRRVLVKAWALWRFGERELVDSVREASDAGAEGEYGLLEMRRVLLEINLVAWAAHPARTRRDVHQLFRRAIGRLTLHRGGWHATTPREAS